MLFPNILTNPIISKIQIFVMSPFRTLFLPRSNNFSLPRTVAHFLTRANVHKEFHGFI